jgi:RNA polymerase sigma-70 factor (ECF subfamily)
MARLCRGDKEALAELVLRYQNDIFRFCVHYLRDVERAKELAQETFLRVFMARDRFDADRKFRPWVLCIARNLCLNELKRKKLVPMESLETYASTARNERGTLAPTAEDGPDEQLMAAERRQWLARALDSLDEESREIIVLRFFEHMPARDVANVMGSTEGAIRTRVHRILSRLRDQLGKTYGA